MKVVIIIFLIIVALVVIGTLYPVLVGRQATQQIVGNSLYRSEDGGQTWENIQSFPGGEISKLAWGGENEEYILAGTEANGLYRGKIIGDVWDQYPLSLGETSRVLDILEPAGIDNLIASVFYRNFGRIIESRGTERRELLQTPLQSFAFFKGWISRDKRTIRVIGSDGGLYESNDGGSRWLTLARFSEGLILLEVNEVNPAEIWVADGQGSIFKSTNGGRDWTDLTEGLRDFFGTEVPKVLFYETRSGVLYHGSNFGILKSQDKGATWKDLTITLPPEALPVTAIASNPASSSTLLVGAGNQVYLSEDRGLTWSARRIPVGGNISSFIVDSAGQIMFLGIHGTNR
ncbi:hypothetical protein HYW53_04000 [Candidatus Giovannonibacteria bacterium]|nr:hypothetical protein [Candidatus Giovannonibacteria bacterium]